MIEVNAENRYVSSPQVAEALGVGVTTVKRWVDEGVLPAHKTVGGHRKILVADVIRLIREGALPHADVSKLFPRPGRIDIGDLAEVRQQFSAALRIADATSVRGLIHGAYLHGFSIARIADEVICPGMAEIGRDWEMGKVSVMEEHRATQAIIAALYELRGQLRVQAATNRPVAVGGAPERDPTVVPSLLSKLVLLDNNWEAINLGPQTPSSAFVTAMDELRPKLIWLSATHVPDMEAFLADYARIYDAARSRGIVVAVGGYALNMAVRQRMIFTTFGDRMQHLAAFAESLHERPALPRRGRPPAAKEPPAS